mmetsp:Transcript_62647/g.130206  ORF Transcript_62647/g.130206 Transcript_62647/m.130206 type:complete len:323 (-) Transcript_62647:340-1308(-)
MFHSQCLTLLGDLCQGHCRNRQSLNPVKQCHPQHWHHGLYVLVIHQFADHCFHQMFQHTIFLSLRVVDGVEIQRPMAVRSHSILKNERIESPEPFAEEVADLLMLLHVGHLVLASPSKENEGFWRGVFDDPAPPEYEMQVGLTLFLWNRGEEPLHVEHHDKASGPAEQVVQQGEELLLPPTILNLEPQRSSLLRCHLQTVCLHPLFVHLHLLRCCHRLHSRRVFSSIHALLDSRSLRAHRLHDRGTACTSGRASSVLVAHVACKSLFHVAMAAGVELGPSRGLIRDSDVRGGHRQHALIHADGARSLLELLSLDPRVQTSLA